MSAHPSHQARILVVDDQEANVLVLGAMLEQAGYSDVHGLSDAREVVPWCEENEPDLILLDLNMPHIDGFGVMERLQEITAPDEFRPILVITADTELEAKRRALTIGAQDFVTKPFDRVELLLRVANLLQTRRKYQERQDQANALRSQLAERGRSPVQTADRTGAGQGEAQPGYDAVTGLPRRALLEQQIEAEVRKVARRDLALGVLVVDMYHFKAINEAFGFAAGDRVLQEVATRLRAAVRANDTITRLEDDAFAVLVPGVRAAGATWTARKILLALAPALDIEGTSLQAVVNIGIALAPDHGWDAATLLRRADAAMEAAQRLESGYAIHEGEEEHASKQQLMLMGELRQAIALNQMTLDYQPLYDVSSSRTYGVEALVRWLHPTLGRIPPDRFVALAERAGSVMALTQWVLEAAIAQCRAWRDKGLRLDMAVNLSMRTVHDSQLPTEIGQLLRKYDVEPEWITLEITESALILDQERVARVLSKLAGMGLRLSIDDFGTGYSALSYLSRLPVCELKIDKSFIDRIMESESDATIVRSLINLGHTLGLRVVAEGVEHRRQWHTLIEWGCDTIQGYYLSHPLDASSLNRWLLSSPHGVTKFVG